LSKALYESKIIVLKKNLSFDLVGQLIEEKKTNEFRSLLRKPKKSEVHVHSLTLFYEAFLIISGKYTADFFRKAVHTINVDYNVKEVVLGDGVFPVKTKSGVWKSLGGKTSKNKIELELEEHVYIDDEDQMVFDHHGKEIEFPFKINSKTIENYPKRILDQNDGNVKRPEMKYDAAIDKLTLKLKRPFDPDVRDLHDEFTVDRIDEVYVPIFEARLIGPKKKVGILRVDAVRKKIL